MDVKEYRDGWNHRHIVVAGIAPDSPAARLKIDPDDEILKINGVAVTSLGLETVRNILDGTKQTAPVSVTVRKEIGRPRSLKLPLYDPLGS